MSEENSQQGARSAEQRVRNWEEDPASLFRKPLILGAVVVVLFFAGFGAWAMLAPIASAVLASGTISPEGSRKTVQHLEGGIIAEILVVEGEQVEAGQPLVILKETQARASYEVLAGKKLLLEAQLYRLRAEQLGADTLEFPETLLRVAQADENLQNVLDAQVELFRSRRTLDVGRKAIGANRIEQLYQEITGLKSQVSSQQLQLVLLDEELLSKKKMLDEGFYAKPEYLALLRLRAEISGDKSQLEAEIAQTQQSVGETQLQIVNVESTRLDEIALMSADFQAELNVVDEEIAAKLDTLSRTVIRAPVAGTVMDERFHTLGAVVKPGESLLDIVPSESKLLIDARILPVDIDNVYPGQSTRIVFSALAQRDLPQIAGRVKSVSADILTDERSGDVFYQVWVEVPLNELSKLGGDVEIVPGMPAEVYIVTGERTLIQYLVQPITDSLRRSFRET
jgi:HlyD family secretion protein